MCRNILLFVTGFVCSANATAQNSVEDYYTIQEEYSHLPENDSLAMSAISISIRMAKRKSNFKHLFYAYEDAVLYSADPKMKLWYADSCLLTAKKTEDASLVSTAYLGKGIIYYFNFRKFSKALDQYLLAAKSVEKTNDDYLKFKIKYHIGVVKSYLGYDSEALLYFRDCLQFFEHQLKSNTAPALQYNYTRGYLNTLHQIMICERQQNRLDNAERIIALTYKYRNNSDFRQEKGYFLKERGIISFKRNQYRQAIDSLQAAVALLQNKKEEGHLSVSYFYLASAYLKISNFSASTLYLKKVDSLFSRNEAVLPEVRKTYELLLQNKHLNTVLPARSHYTDQLIKLDRVLHADLPHLSSRIFREYETNDIRAEKEKLKQAQKIRNTIIILSVVLIAVLTFFLYLTNRKRRKNLQHYEVILHQYEMAANSTQNIDLPLTVGRKSEYSLEIIEKILLQLEKFEDTEGYTSKHITLGTLAVQLDTNKSYLSYVINEHKNLSWSNYLKKLRITYITNLMLTEPRYLNYNIGVLAEKCGFRSRQQFAKHFFEIHRLRPVEFIILRKKQQRDKV